MARGSGEAWKRPARAALLLVVTMIATVLPPCIAVGSAQIRELDTSAVDRFMGDYMSKTRLPGVSIAITRGDRVAYVKGYGHDSTGTAVTANTRMPIASLSKSFTALAVMQLVDAGTVDLDAPVRRYLNDFHLGDQRGDRITVRQLLNQTSGMSDTTFPDLRKPQADSLTGAVERLHSAKLASDPGAQFHYHNPNYQVAARLVEVVSGEPYADYLTRHVFSPLAMADSTTVDTARDAKDLAHGYIRAYGLPIAAGEPDWFVGGSHGIISTATDLARWLIMQNSGGRTPYDQQLVSATAITRMHTPSKVNSYAMGWRSEEPEDGTEKLSHNGDWFTYTSEQVLLPDTGYGIAVIANTGMSLEDDPGIIADGLVALTQGKAPDVRRPGGIYADWALAALTLATIGLGAAAVVRSRRWVARTADRPAWLTAVRLVPYLVLPGALILLPYLSGLVFAGRSGTFEQVTYVWPALVIWMAAGTATTLVVFAVRGIRLFRSRKRGSGEPMLLDGGTEGGAIEV
ncbi:serine hydrolase domain-containing protein [Nocardia sp. NPDC051030]|uniref:serine hydrolase domain-containing protein n=1 Tax=Nocardia sp. NPDC051030 TaxID=3155162 RepID=UPI0034497E59